MQEIFFFPLGYNFPGKQTGPQDYRGMRLLGGGLCGRRETRVAQSKDLRPQDLQVETPRWNTNRLKQSESNPTKQKTTGNRIDS